MYRVHLRKLFDKLRRKWGQLPLCTTINWAWNISWIPINLESLEEFLVRLCRWEDISLVRLSPFVFSRLDYYSNPLKRGYLSSPAVDLSDLGLAPPKTKAPSPLPTIPIQNLVARSHAVLMSSAQRVMLSNELRDVKAKYKSELALAQKHSYLNQKTGILKRINR